MSTHQALPRLPYVLLGPMTLVSFGGPFVHLAALRGGASGQTGPPTGLSSGWSSFAVFGLVIGSSWRACHRLVVSPAALAGESGPPITNHDQRITSML